HFARVLGSEVAGPFSARPRSPSKRGSLCAVKVPPVVSEQVVIGVDLGGTKILAARITHDGKIERRRERPTPTSSQDELVAALADAVEELLDPDVVAVGFGVPARVEQETGVAVGSVNVPL